MQQIDFVVKDDPDKKNTNVKNMTQIFGEIERKRYREAIFLSCMFFSVFDKILLGFILLRFQYIKNNIKL